MFDQLRGNLLTYEMTILESQGGESKKKSLALKASNSHVEESDEEEEDQDFQLLIKKFTKFAKRENLIPKKQNKPSKCFECGEIGHIKPNCPNLQKGEKYKKLKKKQKAYMSWKNEDDYSTDSDDDEVANICFMANDEKLRISVGSKQQDKKSLQALKMV
ncbi:hypothetical protein PIB30_093335 [Stylosanthes scabra]|uniref:CCHC-type domain-containing protein n=1 Tax=Stylosanthes scabra TaxID=79078 RepID=A0ABU6TVR6_9FABA|nr:hypothetical protein [Stylosanthes scabra]